MKHMKLKTVALLVPLSGCALWHDFEHPATEAPASWTTQASTDAAWPDEQWWKQFKSDALSAQVEQANNSNFDLLAAMARVRHADAQVQVNGSSLLPHLDASADATRTRTGRSSTTTNLNGFNNRVRVNNSYNATLNASYELDFWGKNWASYQSAKSLADASRFDQQTVKLTTLSSVATNYFDILGTKERLDVAKDNSKNADELLTTIRKRYKVGIATALDLAQQENVVASQKATIPPLEQHLQQDLDAQAVLLGKMPESIEQPKENLKDIAIPVIVSGLPSELLQRRPDVQTAEAQLASAHADIINARAQFFPSISLTGSGGYHSTQLANLFKPDSMLWSLGGSLAAPIFEGGLLRGQLDFQKARYDELLQDYRKAVVASFSDVEDALAAVKQSAAEEAAQEVAVKTAREAYRLTQQQLTGGIIDITTVLNTQRVLFSAEDAWVQAKLLHLQAMVGLYRALGGGWKLGGQDIKPPEAPAAPAPDVQPLIAPPDATRG